MTLPIFPTLIGVDWNWKRTPLWSTRVLTSRSGLERRTADWSVGLYKYSGIFQFLRANVQYSEFQTMFGFCLQQQGMFSPFLYSDPQDESVTGQGLGSGNGSQVAFPLVRAIGGFAQSGIIVANAVSAVYLNGTPTSAYTVTQTGSYGLDTITFNSPPGNGVVITADFTYYFPARFLQDDPEFGNFMENLWELKKLDFQTLKSQ